MQRMIDKIAIIGAGTMGAGIAGACAMAGNQVTLLDQRSELAEAAVQRLLGGRKPAITDEAATRIHCGSAKHDLARVADCDWICEAIVEDIGAKRDLFTRLEAVRKEGSIVTSNTSGIPLRNIYAAMPGNFARDIAITHFFNPPHIMRLLELIPGTQTDPDVIAALQHYCGQTLGKGVVKAKDTVNFIGNRIGCFWMLAGLHKARTAIMKGIRMEEIDALMSEPLGLPPTGIYGLIDLIGLDIMHLVGKNLKANLPVGDICLEYCDFPETEQALLKKGQLGRKTGGGFYRLTRHDDGSKTMAVYDIRQHTWRPATQVVLDEEHSDSSTLLFANSAAGKFAWDLMSAVLCYAADLVPAIADDIVSIDRAMRWGFNWAKGPFEMIDTIGAERFIAKLREEGRPIPKMATLLQTSGKPAFYTTDGKFLGMDGACHPIPAE